MTQTANEKEKERIKEIEDKAAQLVEKWNVATLTSINENGYPRTCILSVAKAEGFADLYFISSKRSEKSGKVTHFENNPRACVCWVGLKDNIIRDSITLIGDIEFITDREAQEKYWDESHRHFFKKGLDDPKFRLLKFHTREATFWIEGRFRTCKYK